MRSGELLAITMALFVLVELARAKRSASREEWRAYKKKYDKVYESPEEDAYRFAQFMAAKAEIEWKKGKVSHEIGINGLSDLTCEELYVMSGFVPSCDELLRPHSNSQDGEQFLQSILEDDSPVPAELDWRKVPGRVSAVKDQGSCGSGWAFSATGVLEGQQAVRLGKGKRLVPLSEQNLVDCGGHRRGCRGSTPEFGLSQVAHLGGIESEQDYPYEAKSSGNCKFAKDKSVMVSKKAHRVEAKRPDMMRDLVAKYGPISASLNSIGLFHYTSGVLDDAECRNRLDHSVLIVGYGKDPEQGDYWIVKNSWGKDWGEQGYFRIKRGVNRCGIEERPVIATF